MSIWNWWCIVFLEIISLKRFHPFLHSLVWFHRWFNAHLSSSILESPTCRHRTRPLYYRSIGGSRTSGWRWSKWCDHNLSHTRKLLLASWPVVGRKQTWKPDILSPTHQHPIQYKDIERNMFFFATTASRYIFFDRLLTIVLARLKVSVVAGIVLRATSEKVSHQALFVCLPF